MDAHDELFYRLDDPDPRIRDLAYLLFLEELLDWLTVFGGAVEARCAARVAGSGADPGFPGAPRSIEYPYAATNPPSHGGKGRDSPSIFFLLIVRPAPRRGRTPEREPIRPRYFFFPSLALAAERVIAQRERGGSTGAAPTLTRTRETRQTPEGGRSL